jgi:hypothetical protein
LLIFLANEVLHSSRNVCLKKGHLTVTRFTGNRYFDAYMKTFLKVANTMVTTICAIASLILAILVYQARSQYKELVDIAGKADRQLLISEEQQQLQNRFDYLRTEANVYRLQIMANELRNIIAPIKKPTVILDSTDALMYYVDFFSRRYIFPSRFHGWVLFQKGNIKRYRYNVPNSIIIPSFPRGQTTIP